MTITRAEILAVGSELTTGSTADTNAGYLAAQLTGLGVSVLRMTDLPDDLAAVEDALRQAVGRAQLVVSTGGLGPTPDDLTREAIAAALGLQPAVDERQERRLRALFRRRGLEMPDANLKQAWLIDGASALTNRRGTAPGWWVERTDGGLLVALPGPPSELQPIWRDEVLPRLRARGIGEDRAARTLRVSGVGESALVALIGEDVLRAENPQVATYARPDAVDVRVSAVAAGGRTARELVDVTVERLLPAIGQHVFAEDEEGWPEALGRRLGTRRLATVELGTAGQLLALLGSAPFLQYGQLLRSEVATDHASEHLGLYAERVREMSGVDIGLAVRAREAGGDTEVEVAIAAGDGTELSRRKAFLAGDLGRRRAALAACAVLWEWLDRPRGQANRVH
ncbi:MAG TPA: molybdopterin-binding protein [Candidatus Limnocylindria bacterium]|nr:molybdopterin-binding protein [Candidatus Limnocylindria bacterium]